MDTASTSQKGIRAVLVGVGVNACLAAVKGTAGVLGNTYALIADAIESTSDIVVSMIVYSGLKISVQPPDEDHPYGHGKAEPLAAFIVAMALGVAALLIAFQSIEEILSPHYSPAPWTLLVLVAVIAMKEGLFRFVFKIGDEGDSTAVKADAWHHRSDAITSAAAFIGIAIALYGGPSFASADDWAALFASGIIAFNAYHLARPAVAEIMDAAPPPEIEEQVMKTALSVPGVTGSDRHRIRRAGPRYFVDLHVSVDGNLTVTEGHRIGHEIKNAVKAADARIEDVLVHIEPETGGRPRGTSA